jgi:TIR domain-containing protein
MYNLLMTAASGAWNDPTWVLSMDRFLEHTNPAIGARYQSLSDAVVEELKALPALFTYERFVGEPARVGRIIEIQRRTREIKITLAHDPTVPPIPADVVSGLYPQLDVDTKLEIHRTHWAVKEVDLVAVLREAKLLHADRLLPQPRPPKVFLSYSWDSPEHRQWVAQLGGYLRQCGIDVLLDQRHVRYGDDLAVFMERSVLEADRVLVICTENYVEKAERRSGGVGYELMMVTGELLQNVGTSNFIPLVRQSHSPVRLPPELRTRKYFNVSDGPDYVGQMQDWCGSCTM